MYDFNLYDPLFLPHRGCDFKLRLELGNCLVLVGENGLGKSTLLQRMRSMHPNISFLEQKSLEMFYDRKLSVIKEIVSHLSPSLHKLRFERLWTDFGLEAKESRELSQLSGGESQALKICLALAKESEIYFLDEPSQYLDKAKKIILNQQLHNLSKENKCLVLVEHDRDWLSLPSIVFELNEEEGFLKVGKSWTT